MEDLRDRILRSVAGKRVTASIIADDAGIVAGTVAAKAEVERLGLSLEMMLSEGEQVRKGDEIARFCGNPKQVTLAEEILIGFIAKPSGVATAAHMFIEATGGKGKVNIIFSIVPRKNIDNVLILAREIDPNVFVSTQDIRSVKSGFIPSKSTIYKWKKLAKKK